MRQEKKSVLVIEDTTSAFKFNQSVLQNHFNGIERAVDRDTALEYFTARSFDTVIADLSVAPENIAFMKQLQDMKPDQVIFVIVDEKDTDKVYGFADMGIHAFILEPEQLDQALEAIAAFDPNAAS